MKASLAFHLRLFVLVWLPTPCISFLGSPALAPASDWLGPVAVVASRDGGTLFVANSDARQIAVVNTADRKVVGSIEMPAEPTALALSADGGRLYVACAAPKSTVCVVDTISLKVIESIPAGHTVSGLALTPDGRRLYVCNRFDNDVSVIDLKSGEEIARVPVAREPVGAVATPDGGSVFVINHLPLDRTTSADVAAVVTVIDTGADAVATAIRLPSGSSSVRGVCRERLGELPTICAVADVCRPELLVEIEGIAFSRRSTG